ncbi:unnamed protein product [Rhizophagus irregularis]|nr:unnamed protein product [Rhizophagus irregularis]
MTDNSNEWINWIEESIAKKRIKYYDYNHFNNIQEVGSGGFGKVYRANWKSSRSSYLALKSFYNFNVMAKEIVNELKLQHEIDFHENIIRFYGITTENQSNNSKKYFLVMEYANNAFQLANAILFLHDEGIVHRDLHSNNSDVYSIGVLLWEISSGRPPFCDEPYDLGLAMEILHGLREKPIPNTSEDYIKIYTYCWNNEPDNRPTINQVVAKLNAIILEVTNYQ